MIFIIKTRKTIIFTGFCTSYQSCVFTFAWLFQNIKRKTYFININISIAVVRKLFFILVLSKFYLLILSFFLISFFLFLFFTDPLSNPLSFVEHRSKQIEERNKKEFFSVFFYTTAHESSDTYKFH